MTSVSGAFKNAFAVVVEFVVIVEWRDNRYLEHPVYAIADGIQIAHPVEREIHLVDWVAILALLLQYIVEDQFAEELGLLPAVEFDILDLAVDVPLFISKEEIHVAVPVNERFFFQPLEAVLDLAA